MNILKVGMVQQSCGTDIPANIEKLKGNIRKSRTLFSMYSLSNFLR